MTLKIEPASYKGLDVLAEIEKECFASEAYSKIQLSYLLQSPDVISYVAKEDDEIIGFIIGMKEQYNKAALGHIITIDVLPTHRRKGVGLQLLDKLEHKFLADNVSTVYLEVRIDNEAARALYAKKGYSELEPLKNYYARGKHGLRMEKTLE